MLAITLYFGYLSFLRIVTVGAAEFLTFSHLAIAQGVRALVTGCVGHL